VSTVVLANIRRGLQDHLYLTLAHPGGLVSIIDDARGESVPRGLSDVRRDEGVTFPEEGDRYEAWRYRLGKAIEALNK
jgi:hypothetical protein